MEDVIDESPLNITNQEEINKSPMTFCKSRFSVNRLSLDDEKSENSEADYLNHRRQREPDSTDNQFFPTDKFNKVIIPYSFENKKYEIKSNDIEFYENKDYLITKLAEYNNNPNFDIEKKYSPRHCLEWIKIYFPICFIMVILLYVGLIFTLLSCFNPIVIYTLYSYIKKAYNSLNMFKFILLEKFKMNTLSQIISRENNTKICISKTITWKIGRSGYWMEVQKNI
jgi:hypothetical protein